MAERPDVPITVLEGDVELNPGKEWHSPLINVSEGDTIQVFAHSQHKFYIGIYEREHYENKFAPGLPFNFFHLWKIGVWRYAKKVRKSGSHRVVIQVGSSLTKASIHLTVTTQGPRSAHSTSTPAITEFPRLLEVRDGTELGPFNIPDALEPVAVVVILTITGFVIFLINIEILSLQWTEIHQGSSLAVSLFQADAEWAIFLAAGYVALKTFPEWLARRREGVK